MKPNAIVGIGRTQYTRRSGRTTLAMAAEACRNALDDAGLRTEDVDGMATFQTGDSVLAHFVADAIGIGNLSWNCSYQGGGNQTASVVATASAVVSAGMCRAVLVFRSLNGRSGYRHGQANGPMTVGQQMQYDANVPEGATATIARSIGVIMDIDNPGRSRRPAATVRWRPKYWVGSDPPRCS